MKSYSLSDIGCYVEYDRDMLQFIIDHGYQSDITPDDEFYYDELDKAIEWLNDNFCDDKVLFEIDNGLYLMEVDDNE